MKNDGGEEACPLSSNPFPNMPVDIPSVCRSQCHERIEKAIISYSTAGEYDPYNEGDHREECEYADISGIETSHDTICAVLGEAAARVYTIVDACEECGTEIGEQGYLFHCPYNVDA